MPARSTNDVIFRFLGDTKSLDRATQDASRGMGKAQTSSLSLTKAMAGLGAVLGAREVLSFAGDAIQMAVAAEEVDARFQAVFGSAEAFRQELEEWGDVAGVTKTAAEDLASSFGNLAQTQGLTADESAAFALQTAKLAGDIASFQDIDPERVFLALNKGLLTTEKEGLKAFGLAISAAEVDTRALMNATKDGRSEITKADKAYASYEIAVEQAGKAIGDLEKQSESTANEQRQLRASVRELQTEIGRELKPAFEDLVEIGADLVPLMARLASAVTSVVKPVADVTAGIKAFTDGMPTTEGAVEGLASILDGLGGALDVVFLNTGAVERATGFMTSKMRSSIPAIKAVGTALAATDDELTRASSIADITAENMDALADAENRVRTATDKMRKAFSGNLFGDAFTQRAFEQDLLRAGGVGSGQTMATGGTVAGPPGSPQMVLAHGGEKVLTPTQQGGGGGTYHITVTAIDPDAAAVAVVDAIRSYEDRFGAI